MNPTDDTEPIFVDEGQEFLVAEPMILRVERDGGRGRRLRIIRRKLTAKGVIPLEKVKAETVE